jgi:large subunit ribosomal protein L32
MALPKRRKSHARVRTRQSQWKARAVTSTTCPHCQATARPHHLCMACGYYNGRQIIQPRVKNTQRPDSE